MTKLLTPPSAQPKMGKGQKRGYAAFALHLAPADLSGWEVCPARTEACTHMCINWTGRGGIGAEYQASVRNRANTVPVKRGDKGPAAAMNAIQAARIRRTRLFFEDRKAFFLQLCNEIRKAFTWANKRGLDLAVRLNGTSDIAWEGVLPLIFERFPTVVFYDYTKIYSRMLRSLQDPTWPANYHLTFSRTESNAAECFDVLSKGGNVASVVRDEKAKAAFTARWQHRCSLVDGDADDLRFLDPAGSEVLLRAKGNKAKRDTSGFVVDFQPVT